MVFSSIPAYLDQANWPQQPNHHQAGSSNTNPQFPPPPQPPPFPQPHGAGGAGSIRPGSMADRARMANIPMPEPALKCPRCESTNTKFCYFNNYSLSQPRHFCKTCRRYWTRGGALRSVPVGGGCRRNKRSKGSSSKSPVSSGDRQTLTASTSAVSSSSTGNPNILGLSPQFPPLRFMAPLHQLSDYGTGGGDIGLNYTGISVPVVASSDMNFQLGSSSFGGGSYLSQIPLLAGLERPSAGLYPFQGGLEASGCYVGEASQVGPRPSGLVTQLASVKMENNQELNLSRQFLGIPGNNDQYWSTSAAWTDLSGFNTSSTSNPL